MALFSSASRAQDFQLLTPATNGGQTLAVAISADGLTVVGTTSSSGFAIASGTQAARWDAFGVPTTLGLLPGGTDSEARAVSRDGTIIFGQASSTQFRYGETFRWTASGGMTGLGSLPGSSGLMPGNYGLSFPNGTSADGSIAAGYALDSTGTGEAFRWTAATGFVGLGFAPGYSSSFGSGISADGAVIVGYVSNCSSGSTLLCQQAFRWTASSGIVGLGYLPGTIVSSAYGTNDDGSVVVGVSLAATTGPGGTTTYDRQQAFRWTATGGMTGLGFLPGTTYSQANAVNADGSVVVGQGGALASSSATYVALRWTAVTGMQSIQAILAANGENPAGLTLYAAQGVSADGTVITGNATRSDGTVEGWIARIPINAFALLDLQGRDLAIGSLLWGGTVTNSGATNASLTVGGDGSSTSFRGVIADGASKTSLVKVGTGTTTLTGVSSYTGTTTINAGALDVEGSIAASAQTTVNAGGTLAGNGTVGNTTINGGTLSPGSAIGQLTVQGNLVFTAAASYLVDVSPATADRTNVTGTATLGGAKVNASFAPGIYVEKQYAIISAAGGVSGTFNTLATTNLPFGFKSSLTYNGNNAFLNLALDLAPPPVTAPSFGNGLNVNQTNVANALTGYFNRTGGIPMVFGALTPAALTVAAGELPTASQQTMFNAMGLFMGLMTEPFGAGRSDGAANAAGDVLSYAANGEGRPKSQRDASAALAERAPLPPRDPFVERWSVWAAGYGGSQTTDGNALLGSNPATTQVAASVVGADYRFSSATMAGFSMAGGGTAFSIANGLGSGTADLFQAGAFVRHTSGPAYIAAATAYGWQDVTTQRTVAIGGDELRARFTTNAFSGRIEGGYRFVLPRTNGSLTPYGAGQAISYQLPAYSEQVQAGPGLFALNYAARNITDTRSELGLRADKFFATEGGILTLLGRAAWAHDFNPDRSVVAAFQSLPGAVFAVNGARQARDAALTTASAEMKWINGWSAAASFEGEFANPSRFYAGKGVVRYSW